MAADWIKMRTDLQSHPKIVRILSATGTDKFRVIGGLHAVWSVFDAHSVDGTLKGYAPDLMDHIIGWPGFSRAMESVGWLAFDGLETLTLPEFDTHNGQSGKRRAEDQKRKKKARNCPESVRNLSAKDEDKNRTRGEERRIEEKSTSEPSAADHSAGLSGIAREAVAAYNAKLAKPNGLLAAVRPGVGMQSRASQVRRMLKTATEICRDQYGSPGLVPEFWADYFGACAADDFFAGRAAGGKGHENWKPDFEFLTRNDTVLKVYDKSAGASA